MKRENLTPSSFARVVARFSIARVVTLFPQASLSLEQRMPPTRKGPVFMLARAVPMRFSIDFCSQNLQLSFEIAVESNRQMTSRGLNLDSNLNSASVKRVVKVLSALKTQNLNKWYGVLVLLRIVQISQN